MEQAGLNWRTEEAPPSLQAKAFLPLLRTAAAAHPGRGDLLRDLATALREGEHWAELVELLTPIERRGELTPELADALAVAALACEDPEKALAVLDIAVLGGVSGALTKQAIAFEQLERSVEALAAAKAALTANPDDDRALEIAGRCLLSLDDGAALGALCDNLQAAGSGSATLLAFQAAALAAMGRHDALSLFFDPQHWCARTTLGSDLVDNQRLVETVLTHPALAPSADYKATRGRNMRLTGLARRSAPAIQQLLPLIRQQVDAYVMARADDPHPVMARRPAAVRLGGWALVVADDGHELTHIHPGAWLTAVYYAQTPETAAAAENDAPPGAFVFALWPPVLQQSLPDFPQWRVTPQAGDLLIFPSFMGHRTIPTGVETPRICMVLDVMAC